ncbi:MAG: three-Cys-motif partner protein TcmP [Acidobacteriia bacterium]|nr:three-Cys-motif partner protein TcmP [Terriglobia bacterium]
MPPFDEIGIWSEIKLAIIRDYAAAYSRIMSAQTAPKLHHSYIDAFSGAGLHISRSSGELVLGSPLNALSIVPPFREYHLIDLEGEKVEFLREQVGELQEVHLYHGDCNEILLAEVYPKVRFEDYRRALCILDPYGLHLLWKVIETAGRMGSIDIFLNFPTMDMNRNVLWHDPSGVSVEDAARMTSYWGDDSWRSAAYRQEPTLFGDIELQKNPNAAVAEAFRERLRAVARFAYVPSPLPMRNSNGAVVYYLFFASQKGVAREIVTDIFNKYRTLGLAR